MEKQMAKKLKRTTQGLRDALFDEIEELRTGKGDPTKSAAVANLARQIINTAKAEIEFHKIIQSEAKEKTPLVLGHIQLGSASSVAANATEA
jgi:hypothetical protein